jgi:hypothetical protein
VCSPEAIARGQRIARSPGNRDERAIIAKAKALEADARAFIDEHTDCDCDHRAAYDVGYILDDMAALAWNLAAASLLEAHVIEDDVVVDLPHVVAVQS